MSPLLTALLALSLLRPPSPLPCQRSERSTVMTAKDCWAWIVMGESGGNWPAASALVAWTLRAWEVKLDMPPEEAGRLWGWNGWQRPNREAIAAVEQAFDRPLYESSFYFITLGGYCAHLGSAADVRLWQSMGARGEPSLSLANPQYPAFTINCYYAKWSRQWHP